MRNFDFAPLHRSTIGFDSLFDMLETGVRSDWPPYNIQKKSDNEYLISMAIAGFDPSEIELTQQGAELLVIGQKRVEQDQSQVLHRGLALGNFKQSFKLADHVKVTDAKLENGLLSIQLVREIPEQLKPRKIEIASGSDGLSKTKQLEQSERQKKAA